MGRRRAAPASCCEHMRAITWPPSANHAVSSSPAQTTRYVPWSPHALARIGIRVPNPGCRHDQLSSHSDRDRSRAWNQRRRAASASQRQCRYGCTPTDGPSSPPAVCRPVPIDTLDARVAVMEQHECRPRAAGPLTCLARRLGCVAVLREGVDISLATDDPGPSAGLHMNVACRHSDPCSRRHRPVPACPVALARASAGSRRRGPYLPAGSAATICQRPSVSPQRRPSDLPNGGRRFSPLVAIGSPQRAVDAELRP